MKSLLINITFVCLIRKDFDFEFEILFLRYSPLSDDAILFGTNFSSAQLPFRKGREIKQKSRLPKSSHASVTVQLVPDSAQLR